MLGALVHYGRTSGSSLVKGEAMRYAVLLFIFGLIMPGIDNYAHAGGFFGGYATSAFFNPLTRERGDHMVIAVDLHRGHPAVGGVLDSDLAAASRAIVNVRRQSIHTLTGDRKEIE